MPAPSQNSNDLLREVVDRAATDREFRARLLADPAAAIRQAFGVILPHNYRMRFIEKPADVDALIVLPPMAHGQLDEEDLEQVAGGGETDECGAW